MKILISWDGMYSLDCASLIKRLKEERVKESDYLTFIDLGHQSYSLIVSSEWISQEDAEKFYHDFIKSVMFKHSKKYLKKGE